MNFHCNFYIADHDNAAAADDGHDHDVDDNDDNGNVDIDNVPFQMMSITKWTMISMSNMISTAIIHMPALAFSRLPLQEWTHPPTHVC